VAADQLRSQRIQFNLSDILVSRHSGPRSAVNLGWKQALQINNSVAAKLLRARIQSLETNFIASHQKES